MHHSGGAPLMRRAGVLAFAGLMALSLIGCAQPERSGQPQAPAQTSEVILASTTSTEDSGLFEELIPAFETANPEYSVKVIAVGTGEALQLGENKDADVLLVHAKADEEEFVEAGFGVERRDVMYNDFVIVGPSADPAGVEGSADTAAAIAAIRAAGKAGKATFISRGDDSGTHRKERKLWGVSEPTPSPETAEWYEETGQGMGETLRVASEKAGYTLADRATYLSQKDSLDLEVVFEGDKGLFNQYGVIVVTDAKNQEGAQAFSDWILSEEAQNLIGEFGVETYGEPLFVPSAK